MADVKLGRTLYFNLDPRIPGPLPLRVAWTIEYDVLALKSAGYVLALNNIPFWDCRATTYHCAYHINHLAWQLRSNLRFWETGISSNWWGLAAFS
jgi:hypothetical protein